MPIAPLTPQQVREKRAAAHHLSPVVSIGSDGLTEAVMREVDSALAAHGLIKIRVFSDDRAFRSSTLSTLAEKLDAVPVQHIGKLLVIWRPVVEQEREAREGAMPGPRVVKLLKFSKTGNHRPQVKKIRVLGNERIAAGGEIKRARKRVVSVKRRAVD
jgi:putative YhbY family RNA-binding protein